MATNKIAMKFRSITYPNHDSPTHTKRGRLQRMQSFDFTHGETCTTTTTSASSSSSSSARREVSAEGRLRTRHFQHTHSASHSSYSSNTLAPGQKLLRFSDECWCSPSPAIDHGGRQARSVGCLTSPKSRPGSAIRLGGGGATGSSAVERLVDWQRESGGGGGGGCGGCGGGGGGGFERHSLSPSHSYERQSRQSRSRERRLEKESSSSSSSERRSHLSSSGSLLQSSKSSSVDVVTTSPTATAITTPTTPPVSAEGRNRRSQFRRAWSLFSLACDKEVERGGGEQRREKSPQQRILRPPTRHVYRRGLSGLPIECSSRYLGLAY
ncbi:uncharacterized protein [Macrobrachium rosenbergii]|uniref:uncharacterized protein n=1 Tax=Macrobrachium rosenbergii TaxID=79674 RepID=UPI0034D3E138